MRSAPETAADVLMALRYPLELVNDLLRGVHAMKESVTYQGIVAEGMVKARQQDLLDLGRKKFGAPGDAIRTALASISDADRLASLIVRVLDVSSWDELLAAP